MVIEISPSRDAIPIYQETEQYVQPSFSVGERPLKIYPEYLFDSTIYSRDEALDGMRDKVKPGIQRYPPSDNTPQDIEILSSEEFLVKNSPNLANIFSLHLVYTKGYRFDHKGLFHIGWQGEEMRSIIRAEWFEDRSQVGILYLQGLQLRTAFQDYWRYKELQKKRRNEEIIVFDHISTTDSLGLAAAD